MIGWFPRYSPDGSRLTFERSNFWQAQWLDDTREIGHDGERIVIAGQRTEHPAPNELSAGGGRWAAWAPGLGVYTSWGERHPAAGCPTVAPDGEFYYVDDRQGDTKALIHAGFRVASGAITDVRASRTALVWTMNGRTWGRLSPGLAREIQAAPAEFRPIPIDTPDGPWVLNHTHTGIVLRPFGEFLGYRFDNGGQTFNPDAVYRNGAIFVIFTNAHGEQSELPFPLGVARIDLRAAPAPPVVVPVPPPVVNPPNPEPAPMSEPLPAFAVASVDRYVARFPVPQMAGPGPSDEAFENVCRAWSKALAEQLQFDSLDPRWGVKNAGGGRPQSKDAIAYNGPRLMGYDMLLGVGTGHPSLNRGVVGEDITGQSFMPVRAVNHLAVGPSVPIDTPPPAGSIPGSVPAVDLSAILARLDAMERAEIETGRAILRLAEAIDKLRIPAAGAVTFPDYRGQLPYLGSITLRPVK